MALNLSSQLSLPWKIALGTVLNNFKLIQNYVNAIPPFPKRLQPQLVVGDPSSPTPAINTDITDVFTITRLAQSILSFSMNLQGTPTDGQLLTIRIIDNGIAHSLTWGPKFSSRYLTLPATTTPNQYLLIVCEWNVLTSTFDCISNSLPVSAGGTVTATAGALTNHVVIVGAGATDERVIAGTGTAGQVLTSNGASADPTFQNAVGTGTVTNTGGALTNHSVVVGAGGADERVIVSPGTSGQFLLSNGAATDPSFQTPLITVPLGGTGVTSLTAHGVLIGEGTSAIAVTSPGTAGQVLTSNGASADPTFQSLPGWAGYSTVWSTLGSPPSLGNGTLASQFQEINKTVNFWIFLLWGSTTTGGTGQFTFTLPTAVLASLVATCNISHRGYNFNGMPVAIDATHCFIITENGGIGMSAISPIPWIAGTSVYINGTYQAA